jgi:hypothetical protein
VLGYSIANDRVGRTNRRDARFTKRQPVCVFQQSSSEASAHYY